MTDIYLAIAVVSLISALIGVVAFFFARRWRVTAIALAILAAGTIVLNIAFFRHSLWPVRVLPVTNIIVYSDPNPELGAILGGVGLALMPGTFGRRLILVAPLLALCLWESFGSLFGPKPLLENHWRQGICQQTSMSSCTAAAAATLLRVHGIRTTEAEMAKYCLTNVDGTSPRGLFRGLKLKTEGTPWTVKVFHGDLEALRNLKQPVILTMRLDPRPGIDPRYEKEWGWAPGVSHSVVVLGQRPDGRFVIGDPAEGREIWDRRAIETLWHGDGLALFPRE